MEGDTEESHHWRLVESRLSRVDDDDDSSLTESLLSRTDSSSVTLSQCHSVSQTARPSCVSDFLNRYSVLIFLKFRESEAASP